MLLWKKAIDASLCRPELLHETGIRLSFSMMIDRSYKVHSVEYASALKGRLLLRSLVPGGFLIQIDGCIEVRTAFYRNAFAFNFS